MSKTENLNLEVHKSIIWTYATMNGRSIKVGVDMSCEDIDPYVMELIKGVWVTRYLPNVAKAILEQVEGA